MSKKVHTDHVSSYRPPVIAVVGHVDHGKTTLLDAIRKTRVALSEKGGITQHIGAYQISVLKKGKGSQERKITFIDTPGHEAFTKMRSRGAKAADIAILVVAADDSVKPQTEESAAIIKEAGVPLIVAINKIDLPAANVDRVKKDLARIGIQLEGFGGDVPYVKVSAKNGTGITELLDMILLVADLAPKEADTKSPGEAVVVETRLDKGKGMVATVIVSRGTFNYATPLYEGSVPIGKVRALNDDTGKRIDLAVPGQPVEVLGLTVFPAVGSVISAVPSKNAVPEKIPVPAGEPALPDFLKPLSEITKELPVVLKADVAGSLEAVTLALPKGIRVISSGVGQISEADILLAKSTGAFVVGFNAKASPETEKLAQTEKVIMRTYSLIYELLDELGEVAEGAAELLAGETEIGAGTIIAEFPFDNQKIAGTKVVAGRLARGDRVKVMRGDEEVFRLKIKSLRQGKNEVNKVEEGGECGILFEKKIDFLLGDSIIALSQL